MYNRIIPYPNERSRGGARGALLVRWLMWALTKNTITISVQFNKCNYIID